MEELVAVFLEESQEILQQLETDLVELEKNPGHRELIDRIFRAAHTIKGSAGLTGLDDISSLAHRLEDVLDNVRSTGCTLNKTCFDTVFQTMDMLNKMVEAVASGEEVSPEPVEELKNRLLSFVGEDINPESTQAGPKGNILKLSLKFRSDIFETGTDPLKLIQEVVSKGTIQDIYINTANIPELTDIDPYRLYISWVIILQTDAGPKEIEDIFLFVIDDNDINVSDITEEYISGAFLDKLTGELMVEAGLINPQELKESLQKQKRLGEILVEERKVTPEQVEKVLSSQKKAREQEQVNTIRVDTRRLEGVLNYIAELVICESRVKELIFQQIKDNEIENAFQEVDKVIRLMQEEVMKTTMIPIGSTFTRFQRMVRDLANDAGKEIELSICGKETELDKRVIEQITDPLKHMLRNSIDHGVETPAEREAKGKPRKGTITLNAYHREGSIIIEVADDGKGLDGEAIFRKALEKGLVREDAKLSPEQMQQLILLPGFSTAKQITDISGRGVGLDVVATNIKQLRGQIEVESHNDVGTKFIIILPLTLAIIDGMMVTIGEERYVVPLTSIVEFIKAGKEDIKTIEGRSQVVKMRDEYIPLVKLHEVLHLPAHHIRAIDGLLVIIREGKKKMALLVDDILGQEQVVTKNMKDNFEQVEGIAGATILGDGKVALILDIGSIIRLARNK